MSKVRGYVAVKIGLIGYGKMGRAVEREANSASDSIIGCVDREGGDFSSLGSADVVIDFATPSDPISHFKAALALNIPIVIGTTGLDAYLDQMRQKAEKERVGVVIGANFSPGVYLFRELIKRAAELTALVGRYDVGGIEIHHGEKRDAPSGTAKLLSADVAEKCGGKGAKFASLRVGSAVGEHRVIFDSQEDVIELCHRAKERGSFARGALMAAKWVIGRVGFFEFSQVMEDLISWR